ncbi:MAG: hypothetical protein R6V01_05115 [Thermoplasmatota archaeon]
MACKVRVDLVEKKNMYLVWTAAIILLSTAIFVSTGTTSEPTVARAGDKAVEIVLNHTRIISGGISQWGPFCLGVVNRTTVVETRVRNNLDAPLAGVTVNLTIYWYDPVEGFSFDKGRVIHKDGTMVSLPSGEGKLSGIIEFPWVPSYAGSYILNISAHAPGDPRPVTHFLLIGGYKYTYDSRRLTDGRWIGTQFWNASGMDGWTSYSKGADPSNGWHVSDHPLGDDYEGLHTPGGVFWAGNESSGTAPIAGFHDLVSPMIDLRDFDPKSYDAFTMSVRPQIYLLYKYRGVISEEGPLGTAGIFHWIRYKQGSQWSDWEKMYDAEQEWINISGNTSGVIWDWSKRPFLNGDIEFVGIDLGDYQGKQVQVRFEYRPSGYRETGYALDDILVIGKHRVDITPFEIVSFTGEQVEVEPGSTAEMDLSFRSKLTSIDPDQHLRVDCVRAPDFLNRDHDISIDPQIVTLAKDDETPIDINIDVTVPGDAPYGLASIRIRLIAGGLVEDVELEFYVLSRRLLEVSLEGEVHGTIGPDMEKEVAVNVFNAGNVHESFNVTFVPINDLIYEGPLGKYSLPPTSREYVNGTVRVEHSSLAGMKLGYLMLSRGSLPDADILRERIMEDNLDPSWTLMKVEYEMLQRSSIQLYVSSPGSSYRSVEEPPEGGTVHYRYDLIVHNSGNGMDNVSFTMDSWIPNSDISIELPESTELSPGEVRNVQVDIEVNYPIPWGIYNFTVTAQSSGIEDETDNIVTLTLSVGPSSISEGVFLVNGTLGVDPDEIILGREALVSFVVRSYGFLGEDTFAVNLWEDGKVVSTVQMNISRSQEKMYQIPWTFGTSGDHLLNVSISEGIAPKDETGELTLDLSTMVKVSFIDLHVEELFFADIEPPVNLSDVAPGEHELVVVVANSGNAEADLATINLELLEQSTQSVQNFTLNLTLVDPGGSKEIVFKNIYLNSDSIYQINVWIDNGGRWKEKNMENDIRTVDIEVGELPAEEPYWRDPYFGMGVLLFFLVVVSSLFLYLLRRKLST